MGFDACLDHRAAEDARSLRKQLAAQCPDGVDIYFENVGGKVFDAVMKLVNDFARIPLCGRIAHYNDTEAPQGPDQLPAFLTKLLVKRVLIKGFIQFDYAHLMKDFVRDMGGWMQAGKIQYQEDVVEGLENTVDAFQGLLQGRNRGKLLVRVSEDTSR